MSPHQDTISHPARSGWRVPFFRNPRAALGHLCDHVLSHPECMGWLQVVPELAEVADIASEEGRFAARQDVQNGECEMRERLLFLYRRACQEAAEDAFLLNWHASSGTLTVALGTSGTFFLIHCGAVQTAYLPGQGLVEAVVANQKERNLTAGRERKRMRRREEEGHTREQQARRRREQAYGPEERLYREVFRPAVQHIRRCYPRGHGMNGERLNDAALLKECLPPMSRLGFEAWQEYRRQVGRGGDV